MIYKSHACGWRQCWAVTSL